METPETTTTPAAAKPATKPTSGGTGTTLAYRARVRMYRQGLGDCFLITIPRGSGPPYYMLIDCGVILGTQNAGDIMTKVVQDIIATTSGRIDVLVATHEHWDHVSGFGQAKDLFQKKLQVGEVWLAWTEDPNDALARKLRSEHQAMRMALGMAQTRLRLAGADNTADEVAGMLEFFGAAGSGTTGDALDVVKGLSSTVRFCRPSDAPQPLKGLSVVSYVLGPPPDEAAIHKVDPSKSQPQTYGFAAVSLLMASMDSAAAFDPLDQIPLSAAPQMPFFQTRYWGEDAESTEKDQGWRRIDGSGLESSSTLALQLDSATNNTSLVLALELDGGDVLLFAADAQVGNWLSWQDLTWKVDGQQVTGPDLLKRTVLYKVGHHGSHNATLREKGVELMSNLKLALLPVDQEMAVKKSWGNMPLPELLSRLEEKTGGAVIRIDQDLPKGLTQTVTSSDLFYEIEL